MEKLTAAEVYDEKRCNVVLDIDLAGQVSHCFPLAKWFSVQLDGQSCATELRESFTGQTRPYRLAGIYKECSTCVYKSRQECTGGCLAATMLRFQETWKKSTHKDRWLSRYAL
jgi:radical SAM protein with 4Fe4S-binding SPASM domain